MASDSSIRWGSEARKQKQIASALLLALSGGALAFSVARLPEPQVYLGFWQSFLFHLQAIAQIVSITCGIAFSLNRVRDFDLTAKIARKRENEPKSSLLGPMRETVRQWGRITRWLFLVQAVAFTVAMITFVAFVLVRYRHILYAIFQQEG